MLIGYARVSTQDQNLDLQVDALTKAGCKKIFDDKISGGRAERPGLTKALEILREDDTLVVWKLDRLGRSVKNLVNLVGELQKQGVQFKSLTDAIDTGTPSGRFFFHVMASLAEMERELTVERTQAGLEVARQLGPLGKFSQNLCSSLRAENSIDQLATMWLQRHARSFVTILSGCSPRVCILVRILFSWGHRVWSLRGPNKDTAVPSPGI